MAGESRDELDIAYMTRGGTSDAAEVLRRDHPSQINEAAQILSTTGERRGKILKRWHSSAHGHGTQQRPAAGRRPCALRPGPVLPSSR